MKNLSKKAASGIAAIAYVSLLSASIAVAAESQIYTGTFFDKNGSYFGPDCEKDGSQNSGAYYTGDYTSPFKTILGKTDKDIQDKLDELWNHYFGGQNDKTVYYEDRDGAYIVDINNNDIRSEGMSYGMMIAVQTNHKEEFKKLWNWAKSHLWHDPAKGGNGYFSWQANRDGSTRDQGNAPDGEIYFMMSLLFAAHRWDDANYMKDAQTILKACWKGNGGSLYSEQSYIATFQPTDGNNTWGDASYSLPAFVDLFSRWSDTNTDKWLKATKATRDHIYNSANPKSGLCSDYSNFDGTPHHAFSDNSTRYAFDAIRCPMNYGMDSYLFGVDMERQTKIAKILTDFFEKDNYQHGHFNWDGSSGYGSFTIGQAGANAVATYALLEEDDYKDLVKKVLQKAWDSKPIVGSQRYYDGLVHYLAMLHLTGNFKIWKPKPQVEKKTVDSNVYNGVTYDTATTINSFESCKLYEVTVTAKKPEQDTSITNPEKIAARMDFAGVKVLSHNGSIVIENAPIGSMFMVTDLNGRVLKASKTQSAMHEIRIGNRGVMLVKVGGNTYKVVK
ncbi:MAG: glycoside hydrolase [Fibrobacter sp.]|nr:glycoside hydrolase [Fibrobacter sp.]